MKSWRYTFCWHSRQYLILKVSNHSDYDCAHSAKLKFEAGSEVHIWLWPDLVTWRFDLGSQTLHTRCVLELCAGTPELAALHAAVFKLFAKNRWGGQNLPSPPVRVLTRAPTGAGGGYPPPPRNSEKPRQNWHDHSFILFTHYSSLTSYLERSGHQVSLNDPTSHHHFATLRPRQSQSRWLWDLQDVLGQ